MGKAFVRLGREVTYTLSPHQLNVMSGLIRDVPYKIQKGIKNNWFDQLFWTVPLFGTMAYAANYKEQEKLHHRY